MAAGRATPGPGTWPSSWPSSTARCGSRSTTSPRVTGHQQWTPMQERLAPIVRATPPTWPSRRSCTGWHQFYGDGAVQPRRTSGPRATKIDVAGFDIYNQYGVVKDGKEHQGHRPRRSSTSKIEPWAKQHGVAWGLAETGYTDKAARGDPQWIRRTYKQMSARRRGVRLLQHHAEQRCSVGPGHRGQAGRLARGTGRHAAAATELTRSRAWSRTAQTVIATSKRPCRPLEGSIAMPFLSSRS